MAVLLSHNVCETAGRKNTKAPGWNELGKTRLVTEPRSVTMAPTNAAWVLTTCHKAKRDGQEVPTACDLQGPLAPTLT